MKKKVLLLVIICILAGNSVFYAMDNGASLVRISSKMPLSSPSVKQKVVPRSPQEDKEGVSKAVGPQSLHMSGEIKQRALGAAAEVKVDKKDKAYEEFVVPSLEHYRADAEKPVALGVLWWASTRASRVTHALTCFQDPRSNMYLKTQDGRHEVGRELHDAIEGLNPQNLTTKTPSLATIMLILSESEKRGVEINRAELSDAWKALKKTKAQVVINLDERLKEERERYAQAISAVFAQEAELVRQIAATQHTAARMRHALNDDPKNESDDEGTPDAPKTPKEWSRHQVFEELSIKVPKTDGVLGVAITLENLGK